MTGDEFALGAGVVGPVATGVGAAAPDGVGVPDEKGSDVNVASHLLIDINTQAVEAAVLISNDSDLRLPVQHARTRVPTGTVNPRGGPTARDLMGEHSTVWADTGGTGSRPRTSSTTNSQRWSAEGCVPDRPRRRSLKFPLLITEIPHPGGIHPAAGAPASRSSM